jgi:hypothetical protein
MKQLNEAIGVKTYHQIPVDQFLAARKHLEIILNTFMKNISHREEFRATLIDGLKGVLVQQVRVRAICRRPRANFYIK